MAKTRLDPALASLRGRVGDLIYKKYSYGTVVTRVPRMEQVKWSSAQLDHRERVRAAGAFYRAVLADEKLKQKYQAIAVKRKIPLSAVTMAEFMKQGVVRGKGNRAKA